MKTLQSWETAFPVDKQAGFRAVRVRTHTHVDFRKSTLSKDCL